MELQTGFFNFLVTAKIHDTWKLFQALTTLSLNFLHILIIFGRDIVPLIVIVEMLCCGRFWEACQLLKYARQADVENTVQDIYT